MLVTKTKAAALAGVSRRTFYNHIPLRRISVVRDTDGADKVELSELERVYGKETIARNLKRMEDEDQSGGGEEGGVQERDSARSTPQSGSLSEMLLLKERIRNLEEQKSQLETHQRRERDQYQEELTSLRENLRRAQDHHAQLSVLLSDQSADKPDRGAEHERKLRELEQTVQALKRMNLKVLQELRTERSKSIWQRLFGAGPGPAPPPTPVTSPARPGNGAGDRR